MLDGTYQSVIAFYVTYCVISWGGFPTTRGVLAADLQLMGVCVASGAVVVANAYVLLNAYRWDWLFLLIIGISTLLAWFWTGIYSQFTAAQNFYGVAEQVYGSLSFWLILLCTFMMCLLP